MLLLPSPKPDNYSCESHSPAPCALAFLIVLSILVVTPPARSETEDSSARNYCVSDSPDAVRYLKPRSFSAQNIDNTEISADKTRTSRDGSTRLEGNVIIEKHLLRVKADQAYYDKTSDTITVEGNINIDTETIALQADSGTIDMNTSDAGSRKQGKFEDVRFLIPESNMKGQAGSVVANTGSELVTDDSGTDDAETDDAGNTRSTLKEASITSCPLDDPDWLITADEIRLDHDDEYGSADDVVIRFKDVPFIYTPYMEFPTSDRRRSGLLFPEFGVSSSRGVELGVPWYWNIAPNHDAVIEPRYMERRGLELGGNYRFLTRSTRGTLTGAYLPDDDVINEDRYQVRYQQHSQILSNLSFDVDLQDISDSDYFNDFSNNLGSTSQTHLDRNASLNYNFQNWTLRALAQDFKTIDESTPVADRPYTRLPQITFGGDTAIAGSPVMFTLDSELVDFRHEDDTKTTGLRTTVRPGLYMPLSGAAWFFNPAIKFSHTRYDVGTDGNTTTPGTEQPIDDRNLPIASIDSGLFFERPLESGYQQTLEPRLYYLNVPFEDQSATPIFDTSFPEFSFAQLFRDNRFVGGDRIGDANQLTLALTSRILNPGSGDELLRASIGQIYYFEDRKVSLDGTVDTAKQSDVIAELATTWNRWTGRIDLQWDTSHDELSRENYFLHYKSDDRNLFNIGYRKRLQDQQLDIEQTDASLVYAITDSYSTVARWNYSLKDDRSIDVIAGLAYDNCCWSIQLLAQRRLKNTTVLTTVNDDEYDNAILVQLVFKGLGSLSGSKARTTLEQSIYGYTDTLQ